MPSLDRRALTWLLVAFCAVWHLLSVFMPPRVPPPRGTAGRDFASYYYAAKVAKNGGDPYDSGALDAAAQADQTRKEVHPFFYPPPFLLSVVWSPSYGLLTAFNAWFWINEIFLALAILALWLHFRPLGEAAGPTLALGVALSYGVAYGQELGQANFGVLALVAWAMQQEKARPWLAGILLGTACMWKMSPALLVAWWLLRREWVAAGTACLWAVALSALTLPMLDFDHQRRFYTEVLPAFGSGDYNGLSIQIGMFANHSVPNLIDQLWPGVDNRLSSMGRTVSSLFSLSLVGLLAVLFRSGPSDRWTQSAQFSAVMVAMLWIPVYTYEHHLVFALPAIVVGTLAVHSGRLGTPWALLLAPCWAVWLAPVPSLRNLALKVLGDGTVAAWFVQESKFGMLLILFAAMLWLNAAPPKDASVAA
jgi:hypothetical protein